MPLVLIRKFCHAMGLHSRAGLDWVCGGYKDPPGCLCSSSAVVTFHRDWLAGLAKHFWFGAGAVRVCCGTVLCVFKLCLVVPTDRQTDEYAKISYTASWNQKGRWPLFVS